MQPYKRFERRTSHPSQSQHPQQARLAQDAQEVPVGVVFVQGDTIVARGSNQTNITRNVRLKRAHTSFCVHPQFSQGTRHAELVAVDALLAEHNGNESAAALHEYDSSWSLPEHVVFDPSQV